MTNGIAAAPADLRYEESTFALGVWVFLISEAMLFGGAILAHLTYDITYPASFAEASRHLKLGLGTANTAVLLTSSYFMARAVFLAHQGKNATRALLITAMLGIVFLAIKLLEYHIEYREGLFPWLSFALEDSHIRLFFTSYFIITGLHAIHLTLGVFTLLVLAWFVHARRAGHLPVMAVGLYWHFVDLVWVFLFPILYLGGRSS